jgi:hypothetical protein
VDDEFIARLGASEAAETIECLNLSQSLYITDAAIAHLRAFPRLRYTLSFSAVFAPLRSSDNTQHTTHNTQHTTHNTQHTTHNTQHTTHNTQHKVAGSQGLQSSDTGRGRCADSELSLASGLLSPSLNWRAALLAYRNPHTHDTRHHTQELDVSQNKMVTDAFFTGLLRRDVDGRQGLPALVSLRLVGTEVTSIGCLRFIRYYHHSFLNV